MKKKLLLLTVATLMLISVSIASTQVETAKEKDGSIVIKNNTRKKQDADKKSVDKSEEKIQVEVKKEKQPAVSQVNERFTKDKNGIVSDTLTGLQWYISENNDNQWLVGLKTKSDWEEVNAWAQNLAIDGGGWRLPSMDELRGIYKSGYTRVSETSFLRIDPIFKTNGSYLFLVWSSDNCEKDSA